jgi:isopentenyldiphosphate isomerase
MYFNSKIERVMKHKTLEEAAIKYATETNGVIVNQRKKQQFIAGAKYQAERMYSEEEVENILIEYVKTNPTKPYRVVQWFEQFKKK